MRATATPSYVRAFQKLCLIFGGLLFWVTYETGRHHHPFWVAVLAILNSPLITLLWHQTEGTHWREALNLRIASWAFVIGDLICLPLALFGGVQAQTNRHLGHWNHSTWFLVASIIVGLLFAIGWRTKLDAPNYIKQNEELRLWSYSKNWHDFGTYGSRRTPSLLLRSGRYQLTVVALDGLARPCAHRPDRLVVPGVPGR